MFLNNWFLRQFVLEDSRLTILCFHSVGGRFPFSVSKSDFQNLIMSLMSDYDIISPVDFTSTYLAGRPFAKKTIMLTFDDGFIDNFDIGVWLAEMNISAIFFVCGGILAKDEEVLEVFNKDRGIRFCFSDFMSENHLKALIQIGHSIGNHFYSHTYLNEDNLTREFLNSILALHQLKVYTQFIALPYGRIENYSRNLLLKLKAFGYIVFCMDPTALINNFPNLPAVPRVGIGVRDFKLGITEVKIMGAFRFRRFFRGNFKK